MAVGRTNIGGGGGSPLEKFKTVKRRARLSYPEEGDLLNCQPINFYSTTGSSFSYAGNFAVAFSRENYIGAQYGINTVPFQNNQAIATRYFDRDAGGNANKLGVRIVRVHGNDPYDISTSEIRISHTDLNEYSANYFKFEILPISDSAILVGASYHTTFKRLFKLNLSPQGVLSENTSVGLGIFSGSWDKMRLVRLDDSKFAVVGEQSGDEVKYQMFNSSNLSPIGSIKSTPIVANSDLFTVGNVIAARASQSGKYVFRIYQWDRASQNFIERAVVSPDNTADSVYMSILHNGKDELNLITQTQKGSTYTQKLIRYQITANAVMEVNQREIVKNFSAFRQVNADDSFGVVDDRLIYGLATQGIVSANMVIKNINAAYNHPDTIRYVQELGNRTYLVMGDRYNNSSGKYYCVSRIVTNPFNARVLETKLSENAEVEVEVYVYE